MASVLPIRSDKFAWAGELFLGTSVVPRQKRKGAHPNFSPQQLFQARKERTQQKFTSIDLHPLQESKRCGCNNQP